ncbi:interferon lambda receptor 1-like isoform X2 [Corvus kubaryi]|uniref:interferon lambda receptor 1-like isoform X2 n=1 Tax=Corvus kubaryi TaxID=68294 RepID=UPI001C045FBD|nr:interferon lambda receptor 1-like isoform X2 [Corvus kubaryi]
MGCGRMSPALHLLLFLASCSLLQGMLLRPRDVKLEARNFHVWLHWKPDPSSPSYATYEVEWRNRTSNWTKADACGGNSRSSWVCELYFDRIHDIYWARVRAVARGEQSEWASSSELQLYRDTIVGPPKLSWLLQDQILSVNITTPLTPYRRRAGSYKPVDRVLLKLWYWLHLYEGNLLVQQVPCKRSSEEVTCTFGHLKPSTQYCVRTVAADMARERSQEAEQCLVTPAGPAGFPWVLAMPSAFFLLLLLSVAGLYFIQLHVLPSPPETRLPKALALQNSELSVAIQVPPLELEENPLALFLQTELPSHRPSTAGQASTTVPQLLCGLAQDVSGYCGNGFGPDCPEGRDPSCTHSQLGHAWDSQVPSRLEKDGETGDRDHVPEQPVPVGLTGNSYIGDRDNQTPQIWLPLHLQLYFKGQCPALGAGSHLPLPVPSRSCSQEYLQESLGTAGHWVRLSSVKIPASAEEEGGQILSAPQPLLGGETEPEPGDSAVQRGYSEQAELGVSSPCQLLPSPLSVLRAPAFSGYEPRAPSGSEKWGHPGAPGL